MQDCPHCGAEVAEGRLACRECGSDFDTGWGDPSEIDYQSVDLGEGFTEEEKVRQKSYQRLIASILIAGLPVGLVFWFLPTQKALGMGVVILIILGVVFSKREY
ncbi:MAG: hypothetical protein CBC13_06030 [Planctomycetia bacterium TMED53]|nr:MAG: hypothetical protein CBC13_06030 [Planctomycetia bacterium TMED53]